MTNKNKIALAIHGGAGTILRSQMTVEKARAEASISMFNTNIVFSPLFIKMDALKTVI